MYSVIFKAEPSRHTRWIQAGGCLLAAAALAILYFFSPTRYPIYPRCVFHAVTGLDCPGCGSLRAMHSLLHGDLAAAFGHNPLLVLLLPVLAVMAAAPWLRRCTGRDWLGAFRHPFWIWLLLGVIVAFAVGRNLGVWHSAARAG